MYLLVRFFKRKLGASLNNVYSVYWVRGQENNVSFAFELQSNCPFFVELKKTPAFSTRNHCSNHLIICEICKSSIWTYNGTNHYKERHPDVDCPTFITDIELKKMKSKLK